MASMGLGPALVLLLSKGKFLLLGLTKIGTLATMFLSLVSTGRCMDGPWCWDSSCRSTFTRWDTSP